MGVYRCVSSIRFEWCALRCVQMKIEHASGEKLDFDFSTINWPVRSSSVGRTIFAWFEPEVPSLGSTTLLLFTMSKFQLLLPLVFKIEIWFFFTFSGTTLWLVGIFRIFQFWHLEKVVVQIVCPYRLGRGSARCTLKTALKNSHENPQIWCFWTNLHPYYLKFNFAFRALSGAKCENFKKTSTNRLWAAAPAIFKIPDWLQ